ncbi:NB-ARC domain-containing protein [Vibrio parahaemolyticus]|uniref:NB-ARC domain-containing protein n=1 Tax=Vibrio parahaemolyticus TaxID=670 RepID=UPI0011206636|nr:NB-ARC domain-containing protein [Vibrio parahaemolyticus]ELA8139979.1 ATP-binding protein [Vibrio parahaemolyticus]MBE3903387.1 ATP-binding protein [Vibrio parahaemolyticus]MDF4688851.1 NB-ARC domain-containing protein [Vibrio parahaemolyticus]MDF4717187.1 NB-ARC domain-containing protein [Vibrio parahaemolyticus]MDG3409786.1 NB-ARC domain-containing protein [Vibrio parahaemolyticus]
MSNTTTVRLSCFGIISAIEDDLRALILRTTSDLKDLPLDIQDKVVDRFNRENEVKPDITPQLGDYLNFIDFLDSQKILHKIKRNQTLLKEELLIFICENLESLSPCRNRVCHSRPLESTDFFDLRQFCIELLERSKDYKFSEIKKVINNLDDRAYLSSIGTPAVWDDKKRNIFNNLPMVEFDDTGFLGRVDDRTSINKLLLSDTRVITIVGEGGIGKTALAQRCLYDILDICEDPSKGEARFDIIAWVTLKANELTVNGAKQINNAITNSIGLFQHVNSFLGSGKSENIDSNLDEILEYMNEFNILICIDNLETISTSKIRNFLANIPNGSKIIITTRMALGELEYRYKLDKLDNKSSINLMRTMAKILNVPDLYKKNNAKLEALCDKLFNNPLLIRWYVRSYAYGENPKKLVNKDSVNFKEALSFCFENLYDKLSDDERKIILVIACNSKPMTLVELRFFLDEMHHLVLEEAIHRLRNSSMLMATDEERYEEPKFILTSVAESYLKSINAVTKDIYQLVKERRSKLRTIIAGQGVSKHTYEFDPKNVVWETNDQKVCATYLSTAITLHHTKNTEEALEKIIQAKELMPDFSECYRVHAYILQKDQPWLAMSEYETALEYNGNSLIARYSFAKFLNMEEEYDDAKEQLEYALKIDPNSIPCKSQLAFTFKVMGDYSSANSIYEEIFSEENFSSHKKFRVSTYDQASDCQRRISEQFIAHNDPEKALVHLTKSIDIIEKAISNDDYDASIIDKLCKIYRESIGYYKISDDISLNNRILGILDVYIQDFNYKCIQELRAGIDEILIIDTTKNKIKLNEILEKIRHLMTREAGMRINGTIHNLVEGKNNKLSYGFIVDDQDNRYFFSRSSITPSYLFDSKMREKNIKVCFTIGNSDKGFIAKDIEIIS